MLTSPLSASTFLEMSPTQLLAASSVVVDGEVLEVHSFWNDDRTLIFSEALIEVSDWVVGESPTLVRVRTPGGVLGDYRIDAIGFPTFARKERVLLFLRPDGGDIMRVSGYRQGQFRIEVDGKGVEVAVPTLEKEVLLIGRDGRRATPPEPVALSTLKESIRALVPETATLESKEP